MRKTLLPLLALAGFAAAGALTTAAAAPVSPVALPHPPAIAGDGAVQHVQYYGYDDWRAREWRRHEREEAWRRHEAWLRWHREHDPAYYGYGYGYR
jgi:opacity protein-like surface antigen